MKALLTSCASLWQLTVAKSRCEKRIHRLGGPDYKYYTEDKSDEGKNSSVLPDLKVQYHSLHQGQIWSIMLLYGKKVKQWIIQKLL